MDSCAYTKIKPVDIEMYDPEMSPGYPPTKPARAVAVATKNRRRSCLCTCLWVTAILAALGLSLAMMVGICGYMWTAQHVRDWTVTEPNRNLPVVTVPQSELEIFKDQAKLFFDLLQAGKDAEDFVVTEHTINGFASSSEYLRGNAHASFEPNHVSIDMSLPMKGLPGGKGRYLVGTENWTWDPATSTLHASMVGPSPVVPASTTDDNCSQGEKQQELTAKTLFFDAAFHLSQMDDGKWNLVLLSGRFLDWTVPQDFIDHHDNLLEELYNCEEDSKKQHHHHHHHGDYHYHHDDDEDEEACEVARKVLDGVESIGLEQNQIVFHAKKHTTTTTASATDGGDLSAESGDHYHTAGSDSSGEYPHRKLLLSEEKPKNLRKSSWKRQLVRHFAPRF